MGPFSSPSRSTRSKLALARSLGADLALNAVETDAPAEIQKRARRARRARHGRLELGLRPRRGMLRRGGFMSLVDLPPGDFPLPIFEIVLKRIT